MTRFLRHYKIVEFLEVLFQNIFLKEFSQMFLSSLGIIVSVELYVACNMQIREDEMRQVLRFISQQQRTYTSFFFGERLVKSGSFFILKRSAY